MDPSGHLLPLGDSSAGATRSVPSPCWCPSACRSNDAPTIPASDGGSTGNGGPTRNCSPASNGGGIHTSYCSKSSTERGQMTPSGVPTPERGTLLPQVSKAPPGILGVPETPRGRVAERHLESPALRGAAQRSVIVPSLGGGIPVRRFHSPSRNEKADFRPSRCCMQQPRNIDWPLR